MVPIYNASLHRTWHSTIDDRSSSFARRLVRQSGLIILDRLSIRQTDVGDEASNDKRHSGDTHADDDHQTLSFVVRTGDSDSLWGSREVGDDEACRILVRLIRQGRICEVFLELAGNLVGPDT